GTIGDHFRGYFNLRVQMPYALVSFFTHPSAMATYILGQPLSARPVLESIAGRALLAALVGSDFRPYRRTTSELGRNLYHRFVDGHRYRVKIGRVAFQAQPLGLQRQGTTARERIMK